MRNLPLDLAPEVVAALAAGQPVVALESTLIAHGLPWPVNVETALEAEGAVRAAGAVPATIAVWEGRFTIGLSTEQITALAQSRTILKASTRDLATTVVQKRSAATTVAATMVLAQCAGIRLFATGGIGGVHRGVTATWDVSADLTELARTPVAVVCAGAKSILDLPRTLEVLETLSVPVLGVGTTTFPAFYLRNSGEPVSASLETAEAIAQLLKLHWALSRTGVVIAQPIAPEFALPEEVWEQALVQVEREAAHAGVRGKEVTPFLLRRLAEVTGGESLRANRALIVANARLAGQIACHYHHTVIS